MHSQSARSQLRKPQINAILLTRLLETGVEIENFKTDEGRVGAAIVNPLRRLYYKEVITQEEFAAAENYQRIFFKYHETSPYSSPKWDGTPISMAENHAENITSKEDNHIALSRRIAIVKERIASHEDSTAKRYTNFKNFKKTKTRHRERAPKQNLSKTLEYVFEQCIAIENCKPLLNAGVPRIEKNIKIICKILLTLSCG